jgi:hypothetical protein
MVVRTSEGSETRGLSNASDNSPHECPTTENSVGEIVRHSGENRRAIINRSCNCPWMQLIYGVPVLYAPGRVCLYKNVGRALGSVA